MDETNYWPVRLLSAILKISEKLTEKQRNHCILNRLFWHLRGYRKDYSTQEALLALIEIWKKRLDNKGFGGAILIDLSTSFDDLNHKLSMAKLHAYGSD